MMNIDEYKKQCRIYFRAFNLSDWETTHKWRLDDEVNKTLVGKKYFVSPDYERKWINDAIFSQNDSLKLAVCIKNTDQHIGNVYLERIDIFNQNSEFAIIIGNKNFWGEGIGTEATRLMLCYAFFEMNLNRIYSFQLKDNIASIKMHEKSGFKHEGTLRKAIFKKGEFIDLNMMAAIKSDFLDFWEK